MGAAWVQGSSLLRADASASEIAGEMGAVLIGVVLTGVREMASWMIVAASGARKRQRERRNRVATITRGVHRRTSRTGRWTVMIPAMPAATDDVRMSRL